jgi:hypothetical protein
LSTSAKNYLIRTPMRSFLLVFLILASFCSFICEAHAVTDPLCLKLSEKDLPLAPAQSALEKSLLSALNNDEKVFQKTLEAELDKLGPDELADFFIDATYLDGFRYALAEYVPQDLPKKLSQQKKWLRAYFPLALHREFAPIAYLGTAFEQLNSGAALKDLSVKAELLTKLTVQYLAKMNSNNALRVFYFEALARLEKLKPQYLKNEDTRSNLHNIYHDRVSPNSNVIYRDRPGMQIKPEERAIVSEGPGFWLYADPIFGIDYAPDANMIDDIVINNVRVFGQSGAYIQTDYPTILEFLTTLDPKSKATFVDLGSGYGRVGVVVGLHRPDIQFTGFEYVPHRVSEANRIAEKLGISSQVKYVQQDLSLAEFKIPEADIYYMYDPFMPETFDKLFAELNEIGKHREIKVVITGKAVVEASEALRRPLWSQTRFEAGRFHVFTSRPQ